MRKTASFILAGLVCFLLCTNVFADGELKYARLGDFSLENGKTIRDCSVGYRTYGRLNKDRSNAVFFPTWFAGTSGELFDLGFIGSGKAMDTEKYFVISFDNIGNGVSSSPSNSKTQPEKDFPEFSSKDMVRAGYVLLTEHLEIDRLHAIVGISMGGAQAFQFVVSYPDLAKKAISISGTTKMTPHDLLFWQAEVKAITTAMGCARDGSAMKVIAPLHTVASRTPHYFAAKVKNSELPEMLKESERSLSRYNPYNWLWQLKAMMTHDIFRQFGGSEEKAAKTVRAKLLVISAKQDYMVYPEPGLAFGRQINAEITELPGDCGHYSFLCEKSVLDNIVASFLNKP